MSEEEPTIPVTSSDMDEGRYERQQRRLARPTSTIAQSFAADLDSMFGLGMNTGLDSLSQTVEEKKANVTSGQSELEQLEARLRETEQRLAKVSRQNSPSRQADTGATDRNFGTSTTTTTTTTTRITNDTTTRHAHPLSQRPTYPADRPPTAKRPTTGRQDTAQALVDDMPGAMPMDEQEHAGRDDYVMVNNGNGR